MEQNVWNNTRDISEKMRIQNVWLMVPKYLIFILFSQTCFLISLLFFFCLLGIEYFFLFTGNWVGRSDSAYKLWSETPGNHIFYWFKVEIELPKPPPPGTPVFPLHNLLLEGEGQEKWCIPSLPANRDVHTKFPPADKNPVSTFFKSCLVLWYLIYLGNTSLYWVQSYNFILFYLFILFILWLVCVSIN